MKDPSLIPDELRPYQVAGAHFLADRDSALLADEMGLGKTVQTAVALRITRFHNRRTLLVAPASLCLNWQRELHRWAPELVVRRVIGDVEDRVATYKLPIQVLIVSYEQIRVDIHKIGDDVSFDLVILDEAQRIKNASSETSLACRLLPRLRAWALSGTPLENRPADLVSIFRFLRPGTVKLGMPRSEIHARIMQLFLRRTKRDVLAELPPIIVQDIPIELGASQRRVYDATWAGRLAPTDGAEGRITPANMLSVLTKLKQICNFDADSGESAKLAALQLVIDSIRQQSEKILVFSQFVETLYWISERIDLTCDVFHGGLSQEKREQMVDEFCTRPGPRALLVSLKAGGVELNLQ